MEGSNGDQASSAETLTVTVDVVSPPVATDSAAQVAVDGQVSWKLTGSGGEGGLTYALEGDTDSDGVITTANGGTVRLTDATEGFYEYEPAPGYGGEDGFQFRVTDGRGHSSVATVDVGVGRSGYTIDNSISLNGTDEYLSWTPGTASADTTNKFFGGWFKIGDPNPTGNRTLFSIHQDSNNFFQAYVQNDGQLHLIHRINGADEIRLLSNSNMLLGATDGWFHYGVLIRTGETESTDRVIQYIDGKALGADDYGTKTYPVQNQPVSWGSDKEHRIGTAQASGDFFDGQVAEVVFIDGAGVTAITDVVEDDGSGNWFPKDVSGLDFGPNGFHLDFADGAAIGNDVGGNNNNFTGSNIDAGDQSSDSPTQALLRLDPQNKDSHSVLSNGDLTVTNSTMNHSGVLGGVVIPKSGSYYFETAYTTLNGSTNDWTTTGIVAMDTALSGSTGQQAGNLTIGGETNFYTYDGTTSGGPHTINQGDVIGWHVDDGAVTIYQNGTLLHTFTTNLNDVASDFTTGLWTRNGTTLTLASDPSDWAYTPPAGSGPVIERIGDEPGQPLVSPTSGNDSIEGTAEADTIDGLAGDDQLTGNGGDDTLTGGDGDDLLIGGAGDDVLAGGAGNDTAVYAGNYSDYTIVGDDVSATVTDDNAADGDEGTDSLSGVEHLRFSDRTIHLDGTNNAPDAVADGVSTSEDTAVTILASSLLSNDTDVDGDTLRIDAVDNPLGGTVSLNGDGDVVFTPSADFSGTASFDYTVTDDNGGTATATVSLDVSAVADAPSLTVTPASGDEDTAIALDITSSLVDTDGSESLSLTISGVPTGATLSAGTDNLDGSWTLTPAQVTGLTITPDQDFNGSFDLTVTATATEGANGDQAQTADTLTVIVNPVGPPPAVPVGDEFLINSIQTGYQEDAVVTSLSDGGFVVVWRGQGIEGSGSSANYGIFGQRYDASGTAVGGQIAISSASFEHRYPSVVGLKNGGFAVAWENREGLDGSAYGVFGRQFDANGTAVGAQYQVNSYTSSSQWSANVAALENGGYLVTWQSYGQHGDKYGIHAQRYDASGNTVGVEYYWTTGAYDQATPAATGLPDGGFVVTWRTNNQDGDSWGIAGQRFDASGATVGSEFQINSHTPSYQYAPSVATLSDGGIVVTWASNGQDGDGEGIYAQRYASDGSLVGTEFRVNATTAGGQYTPEVVDLPDGGFVIVWANETPTADRDIFAQRYDASGAPVGGHFQVNGTDNAYIGQADVSVLSDGKLVFTWRTEDSNVSGVNGRLFDTGIVVNTPPEVSGPVSISTSEDTARLITEAELLANATDADGDTLTVSNVTADGGTLDDHGNGTWTLTPDANADGTVTLFYDVSDNTDAVATSATLDVSAVADAPSLTVTPAAGDEDTAIALDITSSLVDTDGSESLSLTISGVPTGATLSAGTDNLDGSWTLTPAQVTGLTITPDQDYNGSFDLTVTATATEAANGDTAQTADTLTVSVDAVNDAPVVSGPVALSVAEDNALVITEAELLGNASDVDGDVLSVSNVSADGGTLVDNLDGTWTLTPAGDFNGTVNLTYDVSDGTAALVAATATVDVTAVNDAPEIVVPATYSAGGEVGVNSYTAGSQARASVAGLSGGGYVVVWHSDGQDGSSYGIYGQRYDASGNTAGGEFRLNDYTTNQQQIPHVTGLPDGGFVAVWESNWQDGSYYGSFGQRYDASGAKAGGEFRINTYTASANGLPQVAPLGDGFVATWQSHGQDGSGYGVYGQRYDASGAKAGGEFRVNSHTAGQQSAPTVAELAGGGFVVTWVSEGQDGSGGGIYSQLYDASGATVGGEFSANTTTAGTQTYPHVTDLADGGFVAVWQSPDGNENGIFAQRFDASGAAVGGEFRVNTQTDSHQTLAHATGLADGGFVVAWQSYLQDGDGFGIFAQRYDASGSTMGGEFQVNTFTTDGQVAASVAGLEDGSLVVAWHSDEGQDSHMHAVIARKYDAVSTVPSYTTAEDTDVTIAAADLVATASDIDGDTLTLQSVGNAVGGTVSLDGNGDVAFTPAADFSGEATFRVARRRRC